MTKFLDKKFSSPANNQAYRDNWDAVFSVPAAPIVICPHCGRQEVVVENCPPCCEHAVRGH